MRNSGSEARDFSHDSLSSTRHDFLALRDGLRRKRGTARSQYDKKQKLITSEVELEVSNACLHKFSLAPWY